MAQARVVTGTVYDSDGEPALGASVSLKGAKTGVATDFDGKYSINVPNDNAVLTFSMVGHKTVFETVGSRTVIDVNLPANAEVLDAVVVTAMGQSQAKSKLNFGVQELKSDEVLAGQSANFVNSLQGKVAGVRVSTSGGSPNSASQIVIRAISSINNAQSNEPLFVIDGMPIRGGGSSIGDINPSDIETMSVLKGAAASALYGQEGANGVIIITTKSGKEGKVNVAVNGGWEISNTLNLPSLQKEYIGGANGFYVANSSGGWGPKMNSDDVYYDNVGNFLGTGFMQKYDISLSGGNDKYSAYASANFMDNEGVVPKDYKKRMGVFVKGEFTPSKAMKIMLSANFIDSKSRGFGNSMSTIYGWSINRDMADYRLENGLPNWGNRYDDWDILTNSQRVGATLSPYYSRYMDKSRTESSRVIINTSIQWEPIKNLTITGKFNYDKGWSSYESSTVPRFTTSGKEFIFDPVYDEEGNQIGTEFPSAIKQAYDERMGTYTFQPSRSERATAQLLGNYYWKINDNFNLNFFVGGEYSESKSYSAGLGGIHYVLDGDFYSLNNCDNEYLKYGSGDYNVYLNHAKRNKFGYFGEMRFDYRNVIQLSVTGRLDGSSTLKQMTSTYFYPSFTGGIIFSELLGIGSSNGVFNYGKIRGNWAKVGKDAPANQFSDNYKQWSTFPDKGFGVNPTISKAITLEPEMTKSWEIGADLRFFRNRTRLDVAYYNTSVDNQIVTVRVSPASGTILQTRNEGCIENKGLELTLNQDILSTKDFSWTATLNFSYNRGKVVSLPENVALIQGGQYGDIFTVAYVGESTTGLAGIDYERNAAGDVIIDENGLPKVSPVKQTYIGNREPDCLLGLGSTFTWKDLSLSFLLDGRIGGDVANITGRSLYSNGQNALLVPYRNRKVVFKGVVDNGDGTYRPNTTPVILDQTTFNNYIYNVSSNFIEDGSYLRMSYVTLAYDFSNLMKRLGSSNPIKGLKCSLTGRNLFLLTKYTGADPQVMPSASNGTGSMGIDNYSVPSLRSFNFNVNVTF
ncbi:MAG: SusC/RagA family TonB-linked outer membrane protein [Bacteroidales bacterium]|nr:SusC/RagA family TonB-linked outer membrane protein [Bacteroidales bacterium]MDD6960465.1 SusC/RagA family TonB-linked outer membrane protein [Bacteroidales bacterium]MDY6186721.1 SusC/RagA family TonB-linked outer membrane protein [Muribaculaceae bacterium]